jgi:hypothetical protein
MTHARKIGLAAILAAGVGALAALAAQTAPPPAPTPPEAQAPPPAGTPAAPAAPQPPAETPAAAAPAAIPTAAPPTPVPPTPVPMFAPPRRLVDVPMLSISRLPGENPFGLTTGEPATLPQKPPFPETTVPVALFAAVRVDPTGKVVQSRIVRDPIPSLAAESRRSFEQRWSFDPATAGGQPIETWASVRLDLQVEVRPREEQAVLTPVTPATPLPAPVEWGDDAKWLDAYKVNPPTDGTVPLEKAEKAPVPKRTKWSADSWKGPFSCRVWVKVDANGTIQKMIAVQASDPVLFPYMRRTVGTWSMRPARVNGQPAESWNELSVTGQLSYSIAVKQVNTLRKTLATP